MKKLSILMVAVLVVGFAASAHAASCTEVQVTVTVTAALMVSIDTGTNAATEIALADCAAGNFVEATDYICIEDGTQVGTHMLTLQITEECTPGVWSSGATAGDETYILSAIFDDTATAFGAEDVLTTSKQDCTGANFAGGGGAGEGGLNLTWKDERKLWFKFDAPTTTVEATKQTMKVEVCIKSQ